MNSFVYQSELPPMRSHPPLPRLRQPSSFFKFKVCMFLLLVFLTLFRTTGHRFQSHYWQWHYLPSHLQLLPSILVNSRSSYTLSLVGPSNTYSKELFLKSFRIWLHHIQPWCPSISCTVSPPWESDSAIQRLRFFKDLLVSSSGGL